MAMGPHWRQEDFFPLKQLMLGYMEVRQSVKGEWLHDIKEAFALLARGVLTFQPKIFQSFRFIESPGTGGIIYFGTLKDFFKMNSLTIFEEFLTTPTL